MRLLFGRRPDTGAASSPASQGRSAAAAPGLSLGDTDPRDAHAGRAPSASVLQGLGTHATELAREAAELYGAIDDSVGVARQELGAFEDLGARIEHMLAANQDIARSVRSSQESAREAHAAVEQVAQDVTGALDSLRDVAQVASEITRIALQTRLVAFNAAVEAKHTGAAGLGFGVVAEAVKDLAQRVESSSKGIASTMAALEARIAELARTIREDGQSADGRPTFHRAFAHVVNASGEIGAAAQSNQEACVSTQSSLDGLRRQVTDTMRTLEGARGRTDKFLGASESLTQMAADAGATLSDGVFIDKVMETAAQVSGLLERALQNGEIDEASLFDTEYRAVPGTQPEQFMTRYVALTDRLLQPVLESVLSFSPLITFCAPVDSNGYLPTHNLKFSRKPGSDPVWNAANCRNRRKFTDRTGLAAARNRHRFLLQTYRRDMGGGSFLLMKDISAPIFVAGRHWGGLRIGYRFGKD
jgi:methyl-accepting chemotaxis protein